MKKLVLAGAFLLGLTSVNAQLSNYAVGDVAPNFTITDLHGHTHQLSDYAGKWVMIDFFAYWCGPCASIAPTINDFYKKYGCNGYDVVVLSIEYEGTTAQTQDFEDQYGGDASNPTPTAAGQTGGGAAVHSAYGPSAFPTVVLIGADGKFKNIDIWPISGVSTLEQAFVSAGGGGVLVEQNCLAGIEELSVGSFNVFPNPIADKGTFSFTASSSERLVIETYSLAGERLNSSVYTTSSGVNEVEIDLTGQAAGTYLLKVTGEQTGSKTFPIVKK